VLHKVRFRKSPEETLAISTEPLVVVTEFCVPSRQKTIPEENMYIVKTCTRLEGRISTSQHFQGL
jgi:hypothetical protein